MSETWEFPDKLILPERPSELASWTACDALHAIDSSADEDRGYVLAQYLDAFAQSTRDATPEVFESDAQLCERADLEESRRQLREANAKAKEVAESRGYKIHPRVLELRKALHASPET